MNKDIKHKCFLLKMKTYSFTLKNLLEQIQVIESDIDGDLNERLFQIKKIKEEITKVCTEIDNAKKELTLVNYNVN